MSIIWSAEKYNFTQFTQTNPYGSKYRIVFTLPHVGFGVKLIR